MKKIAVLMLSLCILGSRTVMGNQVITDSTADMTANTVVTAAVESTYSLLIPPSLPIDYGETSTNLVLAVTAFRLMPKQVVRVRAESSGVLKNASDSSKTIAYQLQQGGTLFRQTDFTGVGKKTLTVAIGKAAWNSAAAGTYTDTVTFTVSTPTEKNS